MREVNINPTDILKKDIITSTVILHEVAESIDPTTTMISFNLARDTRDKTCLNSLSNTNISLIEWKRSGFPDYDCTRPLDRTIKRNFSF